MNRDAESRLVSFCMKQHQHFQATDWERFSDVTPLELAATARFLAGVSWFGNERALTAVAARLSPLQFSELAHATDFDAPRFAGLLKAHLRHAGRLLAA